MGFCMPAYDFYACYIKEYSLFTLNGAFSATFE